MVSFLKRRFGKNVDRLLIILIISEVPNDITLDDVLSGSINNIDHQEIGGSVPILSPADDNLINFDPKSPEEKDIPDLLMNCSRSEDLCGAYVRL